ncbi:MAG: type II secretion system protein [Phycisphaerales bacterium]|nr:type II secretion system protein [Phycisphaerales bacterium]
MAFTMVELMVAMAIVGLLLLAISSAVTLSTRTMSIAIEGATPRRSETARLLERITADLRLAMRFEEPLAPDVVEFTVPDLDDDDQPDRVRWEWSGSPDYELTRLVDLSDDATVPVPTVEATDVHDFDLTYLTRTWGEPAPPATVTGDEGLLVHHDDDPPTAPGPRVLFVMTDAGGPTAQEISRENLMLTWGWSVDRITAASDDTDYLAAAALADVAYISEDVQSSDVERKLRDVTIGVVNEEINLSDHLGFSTSFGFPAPASVLAIDVATHPVTATLGTGSALLFTGDQAVTQLASTPDERSPDLLSLGVWDGSPALAVLDRNARLTGASGGTDRLGFETIFPHECGKSEYDKDHVATQVTLVEGAVVTSLSAYLHLSGDKKVRFGLYTDVAGEPGTLLAETDWVELEEGLGWQTLPLATPTPLTPGTYWLALGMERDVTFFFDATGGRTRYSGEDPTDGMMPEWFDTYGPSPNERRISIYANYDATDFAAGRRVAMPWGGNSFDINALTDDGRTLVRRAIEWAADPSPDDPGVPLAVTKDDWPAQCFLPELPVNTMGWSISQILIAIKADPADLGGKVRFELRYTGVDDRPGAEILQETAEIPVTTWGTDNYTWYQIPFDPETDLNPSVEVCLVVRGKNDENAFVKIDRAGSPSPRTYLVESPDRAVTWSAPYGNDDMRIYVYGNYTTGGPPEW